MKNENEITEKTRLPISLIILIFGAILAGAIRVESIAGRTEINTENISDIERKNEDMANVITDVRLSLVAIKTKLGIMENKDNEVQK